MVAGRFDYAIFGYILLACYTGGASLLGAPAQSAETDVTILVEPKGHRMYSAKGHGKCYEGLYYPRDSYSCSVSDAITDALAKLSTEGSWQ